MYVRSHTSSYNFIFGYNYTYNVQNLSALENKNCTYVGPHISVGTNGTEKVDYHEIVCEEMDFIWGIITIAFILLPGFAITFIKLTKKLNQDANFPFVWPCCPAVLALLTAPLFPLTLFFVKLMALFHPGLEWKKLNHRLTAFEGHYESTLQLLLRLFIMFTQLSMLWTIVHS